jgi:hypothetical protein
MEDPEMFTWARQYQSGASLGFGKRAEKPWFVRRAAGTWLLLRCVQALQR